MWTDEKYKTKKIDLEQKKRIKNKYNLPEEFIIITFTYILFAMIMKSAFWLIKGQHKYTKAVIKSFVDAIKWNMGKVLFLEH
ncbi:MAG: hypothetical protein IPH97_05610 [Ignavibacteriales bacterium]|nr:hypothetical protein [Ignavibacteriales bacterium]